MVLRWRPLRLVHARHQIGRLFEPLKKTWTNVDGSMQRKRNRTARSRATAMSVLREVARGGRGVDDENVPEGLGGLVVDPLRPAGPPPVVRSEVQEALVDAR